MILQEQYKEDPWRMLVCCILLNLTARVQVDRVLQGYDAHLPLFEHYPTAVDMALAGEGVLREKLSVLGLQNRKARSLKAFSREWVGLCRSSDEWPPRQESVSRLPGVGKYAMDSYRIFVLGDVSRFESGDKVLAAYLEEVKR